MDSVREIKCLRLIDSVNQETAWFHILSVSGIYRKGYLVGGELSFRSVGKR